MLKLLSIDLRPRELRFCMGSDMIVHTFLDKKYNIRRDYYLSEGPCAGFSSPFLFLNLETKIYSLYISYWDPSSY